MESAHDGGRDISSLEMVSKSDAFDVRLLRTRRKNLSYSTFGIAAIGT